MKLSIISVTYRDAPCPRRTLDSLEPLWRRKAWEHLVADSSLAETREALDELPEEYPLIVVETPPRGISAAMSHGLVGGALVWFLNSGDRAYSRRALLDTLDAAERRGPVDGVLAGARYFATAGMPTRDSHRIRGGAGSSEPVSSASRRSS